MEAGVGSQCEPSIPGLDTGLKQSRSQSMPCNAVERKQVPNSY